jgi:hypothetical protein
MVAMINCSWVFEEHEQWSIVESASMTSLFPASTELVVCCALGLVSLMRDVVPMVDMHAVEVR